MLTDPSRAWIVWQSNHVKAIEATTEEIFINSIQKNLVISSDDEASKIRQTAAIYANVYKVYDSDGRFTIPAPLRLDLDFDTTIVIVGMGAFFHIWPSVEYELFYQPRFAAKRQVAEGDDGKLRSNDIPGLVDKALGHFQKHTDARPGDPLPIDRIGSIIEEITGEKLYDGASADIRQDMLRRQREGQGVKRLSSSGQVWGLEPGFVAPDE
jgi:DNA-binding transcriptional regulator/RsmH inhibitor MraZ